jgi:galactokinase
MTSSTDTQLMNDAGARMVAAFDARMKRPPAGVWTAPGRVNLIGDHTDYNGGFVLPFAIEQRVTLAAAARTDGLVRVHSFQRGDFTTHLDTAEPRGIEGWGAYVMGALWSLAVEGVPLNGLDIVFDSSVPVGSGLSSSAAVACAVLVAARDLFGGPSDPVVLARIAQRGENTFVGVPSGIMDQVACLACREGHALLLDARSLSIEHVPLPLSETGFAILVIYTRTPRALADGAYAERRGACEQVAAALGVSALRDATLAQIEAARGQIGEVAFRRARHVVGENARVRAASDHLRAGQIEQLGPLMSASHVSLRDDYEVSTPALDDAVSAALTNGAIGARLTGAGFGGCALALARRDRLDSIQAAVTAAFARAQRAAPVMFVATAAPGAVRVR